MTNVINISSISLNSLADEEIYCNTIDNDNEYRYRSDSFDSCSSLSEDENETIFSFNQPMFQTENIDNQHITTPKIVQNDIIPIPLMQKNKDTSTATIQEAPLIKLLKQDIHITKKEQSKPEEEVLYNNIYSIDLYYPYLIQNREKFIDAIVENNTEEIKKFIASWKNYPNKINALRKYNLTLEQALTSPTAHYKTLSLFLDYNLLEYHHEKWDYMMTRAKKNKQYKIYDLLYAARIQLLPEYKLGKSIEISGINNLIQRNELFHIKAQIKKLRYISVSDVLFYALKAGNLEISNYIFMSCFGDLDSLILCGNHEHSFESIIFSHNANVEIVSFILSKNILPLYRNNMAKVYWLLDYAKKNNVACYKELRQGLINYYQYKNEELPYSIIDNSNFLFKLFAIFQKMYFFFIDLFYSK